MIKKSALIQLLKQHRLSLSKRLGQNYLIEVYPIEEMIYRMDFSSAGCIVEIGAGLGAITEKLATLGLPVHALEIDAAIVNLLRERMQEFDAVEVLHQDVLKTDWETFPDPLIVGAIPYYITSEILLKLTQHADQIRGIWLIVQKEVADRLSAAPGLKAYGRLSVLAQYHWDVSTAFTIPNSAFYPQPQVDSACVSLLPRAHAENIENEPLFFQIVKLAFGQRRKTLVNCLRQKAGDSWPEPDDLRSYLNQHGLDEKIRGESLSLRQFADLSNWVNRFGEDESGKESKGVDSGGV